MCALSSPVCLRRVTSLIFVIKCISKRFLLHLLESPSNDVVWICHNFFVLFFCCGKLRLLCAYILISISRQMYISCCSVRCFSNGKCYHCRLYTEDTWRQSTRASFPSSLWLNPQLGRNILFISPVMGLDKT